MQGRELVKRARVRLRLDEGEMSVFGSERSFDMPVGSHWSPGSPRGYYIDFANKCVEPSWPPYWLRDERVFHVAPVQWGLGAFERYLHGEGEEWLQGARSAGDYLLQRQQSGGSQDGGWPHLSSYPHTYDISPPWLSAIVQGEAASLLARLFQETGEERYGEGACSALVPMGVPVSEGGLLATLDDGAPVVEEYPTDVPSAVLNGAIFGLWGFYDVGSLLGDGEATARFEDLLSALAANLGRYDTGHWSLYDLYPHPLPNVATPAYHALHIKQLEVLGQLSRRPQVEAALEAFQAYRATSRRRRRALGEKVAFRVLVPRNKALAFRLPWNRATRSRRQASKGDRLVLSYHAVSPDWPAPLSVTPERLEAQLEYLARRGYRGATFAETMRRGDGGKLVAITFDDAYRSVFELARPILERFGMPATVFVPTQMIGSEEPMAWPGIDHWLGTEHERELLPMSWEQTRALVEGGWEIGSHTRTHPRLTEVADQALRDELAGSRRDCEQMLGRPCATIAYPYGDHDNRVVTATAGAGYSAAATLPATTTEQAALTWPRIGVYHADSMLSFRLKVSPFVRRLRGSPLWGPTLRAARRASGRKVEA